MHSGVIRCISDFRQPCISKVVVCRAKQSEIWASAVSVYSIPLTDKYSRLFWDHSMLFRFLIILYLETAGRIAKLGEIWGLESEYSVFIG